MSSHGFPSRPLDAESLASAYRLRAVNAATKEILVTRFTGSEQEKDLSEPPNCEALGRIRHFRRGGSTQWPANPLPLDPACYALGLPQRDLMRSQVFQNAVCNWRCWYCFVDFKLLSANRRFSEWVTVERLLDLYLAQDDPPSVIDLTGGQPDLTPEWVPWMIQALQERGLSESVYLWSDDNLSNDYFWRYLSRETRLRIAEYPMYGRVCCFKGYNPASFAFNTMAGEGDFDAQFKLFKRFVELGIDVYGYATFTTPDTTQVAGDMLRFLDRLQSIDRLLPLRVVPLEILPFGPVRGRLDAQRTRSLDLQHEVAQHWLDERKRRFTASELATPIHEIRLQRTRS